MRTFDACLSRAGFLAAVIGPPAVFLLLVQGWANGLHHGELSVHSTLFIMALAQGMPVGALLWILFSPAAYSVGPGKLVVHSVIADREFSLAGLRQPPQLRDGVITLYAPRRIRMRVVDAEACWPKILEAIGVVPAASSPTPQIG